MPLDEPLALVHDYLLVLRGAERTFAAMADAFPGAPIHTLLYDQEGTEGRFGDHSVHASRLQRLGVGQDGFRRLLPLFPAAAERLKTDTARVVVSSSSAFAHAAPKGGGATHVCYCHSPFRYAWHEQERGRGELPSAARPAFDLFASRLRKWDREAAQELDVVIANSRITQQRIAEFWKRDDAVVLHPPVDTHRMSIGTPEDFVLSVGELVAHKRTEHALKAAKKAGTRMVVVGTGPERARLEGLYGDVADFAGRVDDDELAALYARARGFVMPNVEEFGIAAVEAQAAGVPVVAVGAGGALETVADGTTGWLVRPDDDDQLAEALRGLEGASFDATAIADHAEQFSTAAFMRGLRDIVAKAGGPPVEAAVAA